LVGECKLQRILFSGKESYRPEGMGNVKKAHLVNPYTGGTGVWKHAGKERPGGRIIHAQLWTTNENQRGGHGHNQGRRHPGQDPDGGRRPDDKAGGGITGDRIGKMEKTSSVSSKKGAKGRTRRERYGYRGRKNRIKSDFAFQSPV